MGKRHPTRDKTWIQRALKHHKAGSLHRQLKVPAKKKIPLPVLRRAAERGKTRLLRMRARLALTLRSFGRKKKGRK